MKSTCRSLSLVLFLPGCFVLGLFLAPSVFNSLIWLGRNVDGLMFLRDVEFERVVSRVVVIFCIVGFWVSYRRLLKQSDFSLGWSLGKGDIKKGLSGLALGTFAVLLIYLTGIGMGVHEWRPDDLPFVAGRIGAYIPGVLLIAWIEESLFRGILFRGLSRSLSGWGAAWISSLLYSLVHFAKPESSVATVYGHWYSGFALIPHTFAVPGGMAHVFPYAVMLTILGLCFALATYRTGTLYAAAGLHAGVILGLKIPSFFIKPIEPAPEGFDWFGISSSIDKSYAAWFGSLLLLAGVHVVFRSQKEKKVGFPHEAQ